MVAAKKAIDHFQFLQGIVDPFIGDRHIVDHFDRTAACAEHQTPFRNAISIDNPGPKAIAHNHSSGCTRVREKSSFNTKRIDADDMLPYRRRTARDGSACSLVKSRPVCSASMIRSAAGVQRPMTNLSGC